MADLTKERLQVIANPSQGRKWKLYIYQDDAAMLLDAMEIADSCSIADIECNVQSRERVEGGESFWYDLETVAPLDLDAITQAVRYLTARGILLRHPENGQWVSFREGGA